MAEKASGIQALAEMCLVFSDSVCISGAIAKNLCRKAAMFVRPTKQFISAAARNPRLTTEDGLFKHWFVSVWSYWLESIAP
jgi:hypothetical protein